MTAQPRERSVPCADCRQPTWNGSGLCTVCTANHGVPVQTVTWTCPACGLELLARHVDDETAAAAVIAGQASHREDHETPAGILAGMHGIRLAEECGE